MSVKLEQQIPDNLTDDVGLCLQQMRSVSTWTAQKFELFAKFKQLARRMGYVLFTADVRDYLLYGSGNVCVRQTHPRRRDTAATALPAARPLLYYSEAGCQL